MFGVCCIEESPQAGGILKKDCHAPSGVIVLLLCFWSFGRRASCRRFLGRSFYQKKFSGEAEKTAVKRIHDQQILADGAGFFRVGK